MSLWSPAVELHVTGWTAVGIVAVVTLAAIDSLLSLISYVRHWRVMWGRKSASEE